MQPVLKTPIAARQLGVRYSRLVSLLRHGKIPAPAKDSSGDYLWAGTDLEAARQAMTVDRRKKAAQ
jgi:hypothetical protein